MYKLRCRRCKLPFIYDGTSGNLNDLCSACTQFRQERMFMVREIVRECPGISAAEVHEITDVPVEAIMQMVKDGYLEIVPFRNRDDDKTYEEALQITLKKIHGGKFIGTTAADKSQKDIDPNALDALDGKMADSTELGKIQTKSNVFKFHEGKGKK